MKNAVGLKEQQKLYYDEIILVWKIGMIYMYDCM